MENLAGKVAWVTGSGSGIGESGAIALAREGAIVVLTGRRQGALEMVAERIEEAGGKAVVRPADVSKAAAVAKLAETIRAEQGRLDILVNNAGINIPDRSWQRLKAEGIDIVIQGNLTSAFYVAHAALPIMRAQKGGVMIHTSSWAGRWIGPVSGPAYTAAKHGMVAMSHTLNLEEGVNGIRSCVICPNEVATPIMVHRPVPETPETLARMIQPQDMGALIAFVAKQPAHICINEVLISPTHNRGYISTMKAREAAAKASGVITGTRHEDPMSDAIDLADKLATFSDHWSPRTVAQLNDYDVMVVKVKGEFVWHKHDTTDDFFLVLKGELDIQLRDRMVTLGPGQMFVVPKGVEHRPVARDEVHLLLIEPTGTPNTGDAQTAAPRQLA